MSRSQEKMVMSKSDDLAGSKVRNALTNNMTVLLDEQADRELMNKFRHVYAGRGGWYGYKNGPSGPVSLLNAPFLTPRHRKELLRQAADAAEKNHKHKGKGYERRVRRLGSPLGKYNVLKDDDMVKSYVQVTNNIHADKHESKDNIDITNNETECQDKLNTKQDGDNSHKDCIVNDHHEEETVINNDRPDKVLQTVRSCPTRLGDQGADTQDDGNTAHKKGPHLMTGEEAKRYRKLQLFSRMSQEAQVAMNELKKDTKQTKKAYKPEREERHGLDVEKREDEIIKANQELTKFAQTLATAAHFSDSEDDASDVPNYDVSSGKGQSSKSSVRWRSTPRSRRPHTRLPLIGASIQDYVTKETCTYKTNIPGVGRYNVVPTGSSLNGNVFEITPPGYDSRYNVPRRDLDVEDETPEEIRLRAIEKCSNWLEKYH